MDRVLSGLDRLLSGWPRRLRGVRAGLLVHPASINKRFEHAIDIALRSKGFEVRALFGPQHGIRGETQDNMIEWEGFRDKRTGLPVYSLYGEVRKPTPEMLKEMDVLIIDLQDVGSRYYTFIWTMELCLQACYEENKAVVILDRPNPLSGTLIEGPVLREVHASFVGLRPLPVRHGMTIGEMGIYLRDRFYPSLFLHVITMKNWQRRMWFDDSGLPWVMPSPNMPTLDTAMVYPGQCLLEGTNISEGRGTTRPFEIFGAPFIDPDVLIKRLKDFRLSGVIFRPLYFQPTFHKYAGMLCGGAQIHVTDRQRFMPFKTGVAIIKAIRELYPEEFRWKEPPYEYETRRLPIDILTGSEGVRKGIEDGENLDSMEEWWQEECNRFDREVRRGFLIYK